MGKEDKFDLALAPSELLPKTKPEEKKEDIKDIQISEGILYKYSVYMCV